MSPISAHVFFLAILPWIAVGAALFPEKLDVEDVAFVPTQLDPLRLNPFESGRRLEASQNCSDAQAFYCFFAGQNIYSSCGGIFEEIPSNWCLASNNTQICCGNESDCCKVKPAARAGLLVGLIALIALIVLGSCYCCKCCCMYDSLHGISPAGSNAKPIQSATAVPVVSSAATAFPTSSSTAAATMTAVHATPYYYGAQTAVPAKIVQAGTE